MGAGALFLVWRQAVVPDSLNSGRIKKREKNKGLALHLFADDFRPQFCSILAACSQAWPGQALNLPLLWMWKRLSFHITSYSSDSSV
jgi:hypothetical protein